MAIKFQKKNKDKKNRKSFVLNEKKKIYIKFMILKYQRLLLLKQEKKKSLILIRKLQHQMQVMPKVKINNYCVLTGRDKGVYRDFKLSRHQIRGNFKFLTGLRNSSF